MLKNLSKKFTPLMFLASLGMGGLSIAGFAFLNYTIPHGKGLINVSQINDFGNPRFIAVYLLMEVIMVLFATLHFVTQTILIGELLKWLKTKDFKKMYKNPLTNSAVITPFISVTMSLNVLLAVARYFIPALYENLQQFMLPGLIFWSILWATLLWVEFDLLKISFATEFDISKISFGWLLHPFALAMVTVSGTGIAALAKNIQIADIAAFMSLISGTMGMFLLAIKLVTIFKSHYASKKLPEKRFLTSILIVVPNITLYAISLFRLSHYVAHRFNTDTHIISALIVTTAFAFETWYMIFGLKVLKSEFKGYLKKEFHVTQWGLVCPFVAYAVLGSFVYATFSSSLLLLSTIILTTLVTTYLIVTLLIKQLACLNVIKYSKLKCLK